MMQRVRSRRTVYDLMQRTLSGSLFLPVNKHPSTIELNPSSRCCFPKRHHSYLSTNRSNSKLKLDNFKLYLPNEVLDKHCVALHTKSSNNSKNEGEGEGQLEKRDAPEPSLLETWFYEVCQYGSLTANLPFNTVIKPLNPQEYPDMNKVIIQLHYNGPMSSDCSDPPSHQLSQIAGLYDMNVTFDDDRANMNFNFDLIEGLDLPVHCTVYVPLKFGLLLNGNKNVHVEKMESDKVVIETESGDCTLHSMKCGSVSVVSQCGNIHCNSTILGNTILYTGGSGGISVEKIQGSGVSCKTEMGPLSVKSLYTDAATFNTVVGNINLGHCHGQVHVLAENCHLNIDSLDGDLDVALQNGSVNVLLSRHNRVDIDIGTGDIGLSFPEGAATDLNLNCPDLKVHENVKVNFQDSDLPHHKEGFISQSGVSQVNARTLSGTIGLRILDWIETTKLAFKKED